MFPEVGSYNEAICLVARKVLEGLFSCVAFGLKVKSLLSRSSRLFLSVYSGSSFQSTSTVLLILLMMLTESWTLLWLRLCHEMGRPSEENHAIWLSNLGLPILILREPIKKARSGCWSASTRTLMWDLFNLSQVAAEAFSYFSNSTE